LAALSRRICRCWASVKELFRDVDRETMEKITYKNAEKLFKFPLTVPS
jgi:predicted TIM-barrel fold metal-dependent hydrolase